MFDKSGSTRLYNTLMGNPNAYVAKNNSIGRYAGGGSGDNFFTKKAKSIENTLGTTGAAIIGGVNERIANKNRDDLMRDNQTRMNEVAKKYGYNTYHDVWDARDKAEAEGDQATLDFIDNTINPELQGQANENAKKLEDFSSNYKDYVQNDYIGKKINQDQGKYLGSAINTMSTATDVLGLTNGPLSNAIQGGIEGVADELEQSGFKDFSWERAGQNALTGAASGAVTGALNAKINGALAKRGGNLLKGGNKLTQAINNFNTTNPVGQLASALGTGAARGAISGAVGGATGAGISAAMNNQDVLGSALQGAKQGAISGAGTGAIMTGANMAIDKTPGVGKFLRNVNQAQQDWKNSGSNFDERLTNTLTSGDSAVGEWLQGNRKSKLLGTAGNIGNRIIMEDGKPKPFYHGSPVKGIEDFDLSKAGRNTRSGEKAIFFTDDLPTADEFSYERIPTDDMFVDNRGAKGEVYTRNLNLENPLNLGNLTESQIDELWDYAAPIAKMDGKEKFVNNMKDFSQAGNDQLIKSQLDLNLLRESPYDGIIAKMYPGQNDVREYGVFDTNKIVNPETVSDQQTPTTLGGWLKKAGQRVVEDANNRGVGMSVKDVSNITDAPRIDPWDRLAQQNGYNNYDEVIQRYMEANPNAEINPRGMAGAITTWMDNNPGDNPTTVGGWAKKAGQRIVDSMKNRGVGLSVKDVSNNGQGYSNDIKNLKINQNDMLGYAEDNAEPITVEEALNRAGLAPSQRKATQAEIGVTTENPETEVYRALSKSEEPIDLTEAFGDKGLGTIEQRNKLQAIGKQLQNSAKTQKYGAVFDSLDAGTARRATETQAPQRLAELGVQPQDYTESAKVSSYVNQVVSDLADRSKVKVNVPDLPERLSASELSLPFSSDSNLKTYEQSIRRLTTADGDSPSQYSASQLLETSRKLGKMAAGVKGNTEGARELRNAYTEAKYVMRDLASDALEKSGVTGDATTDMIAKGLKDLGANEKIVDYITASNDGNAPTAKDLVHRTALFEQARDMGNQIEAEKYTRSASKAPSNPMTRIWRASGLDQPIETILRSTVAPIASGMNIYNAIGRNEGRDNAQQARTANYLVNAAQEAEVVNDNTGVGTTMNPQSTSVYNTLYGQTSGATQAQPTTSSTGYFQPTGDYWTDILASAMSKAIDADDVEAFASLYGMYQDQLSNLQKQADSSTSQEKLTDKQRSALAAERALDELESVSHNFAYDVSDIPVLGNIANFGGNDYKSKAEALALQVGYMLSGATVNKEEAKKIGESYVPQPRDNEAVRQSKLAQLRGIISDYQKS